MTLVVGFIAFYVGIVVGIFLVAIFNNSRDDKGDNEAPWGHGFGAPDDRQVEIWTDHKKDMQKSSTNG